MTDNRTETMVSAEVMPEIWDEPVSCYTRQEAIEDGVLVDAQVGDFQEVTWQHLGDCPCVMTLEVFALIEQAVLHPKHGNDWAGVWHDILWMLAVRRRPLPLGERRRARVKTTAAAFYSLRFPHLPQP